nr:uncharacterized protein LOC129450264 [Misgurnus anguillicaudatus]
MIQFCKKFKSVFICRMREIEESEALLVQQMDRGCKSSWKWSWLKLETTIQVHAVKHTFILSDFFKKIEKKGCAKCTLCMKEINYSSRGVHALFAHCQTSIHTNRVTSILSTQSVAQLLRKEDPLPATQNQASAAEKIRESVKLPVPMCNRIANAEAIVLAVIAEHSLPLTMAPVLVELSQCLAADKAALSQIKVSRTAASYKIVYGMGRTFAEKTFSNLRRYPFSLNVDESTSSSFKKVLSMLVSYFNEELNDVVVEHLGSLEVWKVTSASLERLMFDFFQKNNIPWLNLISIMLDSCNVMRGSKSGLETRIRERHCPTLLDVDGDSCHHVHNAAKRFAEPFENYLEQLFADIHTDHQWASDQLAYLKEIAEFLGIPATNPQRFVSHRWLSAYDVAINTKRMLPVFKVLYFGFMGKQDQELYNEILEDLYRDHGVSDKAQRRVRFIHQDLCKEGMTDLGKKRKARIVKKIWVENQKVDLNLSVYLGVLPILKEYVMVFQVRK